MSVSMQLQQKPAFEDQMLAEFSRLLEEWPCLEEIRRETVEETMGAWEALTLRLGSETNATKLKDLILLTTAGTKLLFKAYLSATQLEVDLVKLLGLPTGTPLVAVVYIFAMARCYAHLAALQLLGTAALDDPVEFVRGVAWSSPPLHLLPSAVGLVGRAGVRQLGPVGDCGRQPPDVAGGRRQGRRRGGRGGGQLRAVRSTGQRRAHCGAHHALHRAGGAPGPAHAQRRGAVHAPVRRQGPLVPSRVPEAHGGRPR